MKFGIAGELKRGLIDNGPWVKAFAQTAEKSGAESLWISEHPVIAENHKPLYTYSKTGIPGFQADTIFPSPLEWLAFCAACTEKINLITGVLLLPLHSPTIIAKRISTVDAMSGGRVQLGVGLGWQIEEFEAVGVPYSERGKRMDEMIPAIRALWRDWPASYEGEFYKFSRLYCDVKPAQAGGPPIIMGGSTDVAARRAGRLADGYYPYAISPETYAGLIETMRASAKEHGRNPDDIQLTASPAFWRDGGGNSLDLGLARAYKQAGAQRFLFNTMEAGSDMKDIERFILTYREKIIEKV